MRNFIYLIAVIVCAGVFSCTKSTDEYVVSGTTSQSRLNGQKVYLVPYGSPQIEDSLGVDSAVIENGRFEFRGNKGEFLARITLDRRVRFGTQDLLIVTEPGTINVVIDSISKGGGTPQNDALQTWKDLKEDHDKVQWNQSQHIKYLRHEGDTVYANSLADSLKNFNATYRTRIHDLMRTLSAGTAYNLLRQFYGDPE